MRRRTGCSAASGSIQKIKDSGADGLWVALAEQDAVSFGRQAKQHGLLDKTFNAAVSFVMDQNMKVLGDVSKGNLEHHQLQFNARQPCQQGLRDALAEEVS